MDHALSARYGVSGGVEISLELLGPVRLRCDRRPVELPPGKPRALLTLLLLQPNSLLTTERLVAELWGDQPPRSALANLRTYAAILRRILPAAGVSPCRLRAGRSGCLLEVGRARVRLDAGDFERLVAAGSASVTRGEPQSAATQFAQALALWRGRALEDVPNGPVLSARATALEEQRLTAIEDLAAARLDTADYLTAITPLRLLLREHPYRERAWALLMTALYGTGDVSTALRTYAEARAKLVGELGVEPGEELRETHRAVLRGSLALPTNRAAARPPAALVAVPHQLPPDPADFSGRARLLHKLIQLIRSGSGGAPPVAVLSGVGGAGKTTLAVRCAHLVAPAFPDGQLFADLGGFARPADAADILAGFLVALGVAPARVPESVGERAALFRSTVAGRRVLIVADNATTAAQIRPLLPGDPGCGVLITSRRRLTALPGAQLVEVGLLTGQESMQMLARMVGARRISADPAAASRLCAYGGGLPLALRVIAGRLLSRPHWSAQQLAESLSDERRRLDELVADDLAVRASIGLSHRELTPECATALRSLAVLPVADAPAWAAAAMLSCPVPRAERMLELIVDARLLDAVPSTHSGPARYRMHELVRLFARAVEPTGGTVGGSKLDKAAVTVVGKAGAAWLTLAECAAERLPTGYAVTGHGSSPRWTPEPAVEQAVRTDPLGWFDAERVALREVVAAAAALDLHELAWDLATTAMRYYNLRWHVDDWRETHEAALAAVRRAGNLRGEACLLRSVGERAANLADYRTAARHLKAALHRFGEFGDRRGQAHTLLGLGNVQRLSGRPDDARTTYALATRLGQGLGDRLLEADLINNSCVVSLQQGRLTEAAAGFAEAQRIYQALSDHGGVTRSLRGLARVRQQLGDHEQAIVAIRAACEAVEVTGDARAVAFALADLSRACLAAGRLAEAGAALDRCLLTYEDTYDPFGHGTALAVSAELSLALGDARHATQLARRAVEMLGHAGNPVEQAKSLRILSMAQQALGNTAEASAVRRAASAIFARLSLPDVDEAGHSAPT